MKEGTAESTLGKWDAAGIALSVLCGIHCLAMPFFFGVLPWLGMEALHDHRFEWTMVALIAGVATVTYVRGYLAHRRWELFLLLGFGLAMFLGVRPWLAIYHLHGWEHVATLVGGVVYVAGHWLNLRWTRHECHCAVCH